MRMNVKMFENKMQICWNKNPKLEHENVIVTLANKEMLELLGKNLKK